MSSTVQRKIRPSKLREIEPYLKIVDKIKTYGITVKEILLENLPDEIQHIPDRVKEVYSYIITRRDLIFDEILVQYRNIPNLELLTRYIIFYCCVTTGVKNFRVEKLLKSLKECYPEYKQFLEQPEYNSINKIVNLIKDRYGDVNENELSKALTRFTYGIRKITRAYKCQVFEWIMKFRDLKEFETSLRMFFTKKFNDRKRRALRTIVRMFIHETNIPIAINLIKSGVYRKYVPIVDIYSTLVTMRSGAFLILKPDLDKVKNIEIMIKSSQESIKFRLDYVKGIVRNVAKLSTDPILYERGAFNIGYRYCSKNNCNECPINDICKKFTHIIVK